MTLNGASGNLTTLAVRKWGFGTSNASRCCGGIAAGVLADDIGEEGSVEVGWGEERFFQARETTVGMALRAVLQRNSSVLQVVPLPGPARDYFRQSNITEIRVEEQGYRAALAFVAESFTCTPAPGVIRCLRAYTVTAGSIVRKEPFMPSIPVIHGWQGQSRKRDRDASRYIPGGRST
jgi:hypothetical protein